MISELGQEGASSAQIRGSVFQAQEQKGQRLKVREGARWSRDQGAGAGGGNGTGSGRESRAWWD